VTFEGVWEKGVLGGVVVFKYNNGTIKKAMYSQGKFESWIDNSNHINPSNKNSNDKNEKNQTIGINELKGEEQKKKGICCVIL